MNIKQIAIQKNDSFQQITATIDKLILWFRIPVGIEVDPLDATPFVQLSLIQAMMFGESIEVDQRLTVSPHFLANIEHIQSVYKTWNPIFKRISVNCRQAVRSYKTAGTGSLFSSGVDGTYTFLKHRQEIDQLIFINGFEANYSTEIWRKMVEKNRVFSQKMGVGLIPVETNHRSFLAAFELSGFANFGFRLAAIGQLLGFDKVLISSSDTYENLMPVGSHPLVDPFLSTETTVVEHVGLEADRAAKLALIKNTPVALKNVNVCQLGGIVNCGECSKCIRTYVALLLNGIDDFPFKAPLSLKQVARVSISTEEQALFFEKFVQRADQQCMTKIAKVLRRRLTKYYLKKLLLQIEASYLPIIGRMRQSRRPEHDKYVSVNVFPRYSDQSSVDQAKTLLQSESFVQEQHDIGTVY